MKISIPLYDLNISGGVRIVVQYACGLKKLGHDVLLVVPADKNNKYIDFKGIIEIKEVKANCLLYFFSKKIANAFAIRKNIPKCNVYLLYSWQAIFTLLFNNIKHNSIYLLIQADDSVISNDRPWIIRMRNNFLFNIIYKLDINKIAVSHYLQVLLKKKYSIDTFCVPNGVDKKSFIGLEPSKWTPPNDRFDILCLPRNLKRKGLEDLVISVQILIEKYQELNIRIIAATQDKIKIPEYINHLIVKPQNDIQLGQLYRTCNIFVFTSWIESFGLPPLEAMSCGVPVITTNCGGVMEYARNGNNCLVVPPNNPTILASTIDKLRLDQDLQKKLSRNGLKTSKKFTINKSVRNLEKLMMDFS